MTIWLLMREHGVKHESEFRPFLAFASKVEAETVQSALRVLINMRRMERLAPLGVSLDQIETTSDEMARKVGDEAGLAEDYDLVEVPLRGDAFAQRMQSILIDCVYAARDPKWPGGDAEIDAIIARHK